MADQKQKYKVKDSIKGYQDRKHTFYRVDRELTKDFFVENKEILKANIYVHRIFANILQRLSYNQFSNQNSNYAQQLNLFEKNYLTEDNEAISFEMSVREVSNTRSNYKNLEEALFFLESYKKQWYTSVNDKGEKIRTLGGLIADPKINKGKGTFMFYITSYWLKKILEIGDYTKTFYSMIQNISSNKHVLFWYWLSLLPEEGTKINYQKINERYDVSYKSARDVVKAFLIPIKKKFDKYSHISFNVSYKGDIISIAKYHLNAETFSLEKQVSEKEKENLVKEYKASYLKKRHQLNSEIHKKLRVIGKYDAYVFNTAYGSFIEECRENKVKATSFKGKDFVEKYNECLKKAYLQTMKGIRFPNGYPKI